MKKGLKVDCSVGDIKKSYSDVVKKTSGTSCTKALKSGIKNTVAEEDLSKNLSVYALKGPDQRVSCSTNPPEGKHAEADWETERSSHLPGQVR